MNKLTNERTSIRADERKDENYISLGINAEGIIIRFTRLVKTSVLLSIYLPSHDKPVYYLVTIWLFQPMYGTDTALTDGLGKLRKCKFTTMVGNSTLKTCNYQCDCTGDGCNTLALFMLHKDETPTGPYQLCELTIT